MPMMTPEEVQAHKSDFYAKGGRSFTLSIRIEEGEMAWVEVPGRMVIEGGCPVERLRDMVLDQLTYALQTPEQDDFAPDYATRFAGCAACGKPNARIDTGSYKYCNAACRRLHESWDNPR